MGEFKITAVFYIYRQKIEIVLLRVSWFKFSTRNKKWLFWRHPLENLVSYEALVGRTTRGASVTSGGTKNISILKYATSSKLNSKKLIKL